ncbi:MAG: methyltransferase domain-containing protein [Solirubrobacteraceae bacterium]
MGRLPRKRSTDVSLDDARTDAARTHFDRWSRTYESDRSSRRLGEIQRRALAKLELGPDDVFLDVACGTGAAVRAAAAVARRAVGFDVSAGMIGRARELAGRIDNAEFVEGDVAQGLPFEDGEFTAVLCTTAFHHLPRQREALAELARVLAPSGRIVISDANRRHPAVFALDLVLRRTQRSHVGMRSPKWIARRLRRAGLHDVSVETTWRGLWAITRAEKPAKRGLRLRRARP